MNGLSQSPSFTPVARRRLRCPARASPFLIVSERIDGGEDSAAMAEVSGSSGNGRGGNASTTLYPSPPGASIQGPHGHREHGRRAIGGDPPRRREGLTTTARRE